MTTTITEVTGKGQLIWDTTGPHPQWLLRVEKPDGSVQELRLDQLFPASAKGDAGQVAVRVEFTL